LNNEEKSQSNSKILAEIALTEYQSTFRRKNTLESKASTYVIIISILLTASVSLYVGYTKDAGRNCLGFIFFVVFIAEIYSSILAMVFMLLAQKTKEFKYFDLNKIKEYWGKDDNYLFGTIYKTCKEYIDYNNKEISKIETFVKIVYQLSLISVITFIILMFITFLIINC